VPVTPTSTAAPSREDQLMRDDACPLTETLRAPLTRRAVLRAAAGGFGLAALQGPGRPATAQAKYKLKIGGVFPATAQASKTMQRFADLIGQKTGGQVEVSVFPAGQLGDEQQLLQTALTPGFCPSCGTTSQRWPATLTARASRPTGTS
jgi:hypothetical protein